MVATEPDLIHTQLIHFFFKKGFTVNSPCKLFPIYHLSSHKRLHLSHRDWVTLVREICFVFIVFLSLANNLSLMCLHWVYMPGLYTILLEIKKMTITNDQLSQKSIKLKNCDDKVILLFQSWIDLFVLQHFSMVKD